MTQSCGVVQRGATVVIHMIGMRSAQIDQRFHASRVSSRSRAVKRRQSVFVRSARGRRTSGSKSERKRYEHVSSKCSGHFFFINCFINYRAVTPTSPEPIRPPRYPRSPPTESVVVRPRLSRSRPRRIREVFAKLSDRLFSEQRVRPWRPPRNIERHNEAEIRRVNRGWRVARQPPEPIERIPFPRRLKMNFLCLYLFFSTIL